MFVSFGFFCFVGGGGGVCCCFFFKIFKAFFSSKIFLLKLSLAFYSKDKGSGEVSSIFPLP